ncbi:MULTISPECIES: hypothetical protein [Rhodococcus]|uniref:hypothetical protein n=1 Tax=Rhodococcus TaxID=1827 RepID=UPI001E3D4B87|nr:hypothetical protein [Rhodococcus pyridinivorans]MCD2116672.1 hypothetical protein [Rhodococcus pyridinivorans]MCZ4625385.1 hypothetical protein [Rhodococcus pyridinivorans]MCZ4646595.1 hypothetical protein [Rhodococcus pyridinivorans]MDJ0483737.1 hypothetical protein [Rhodococcus pyridinivorans]MDV7252852.1 hypothetical protein [Rhodococcus pyridinivorans]
MGDIVRQGVAAFVAEVLARGGRAELIPGQRDVRVQGADGSERVVRVCSTASDPWLARRRDGVPAADGAGVSYWVFVDLAPELPEFHVVDADDIEGGIEEEVALWLADRPGRTPTGSHPIQRSNVVHGQDHWDLLGLDAVKDPDHDAAPVPAAAVRVARPATPAVVEPDTDDGRLAVVADIGGYRVQGRVDLVSGTLEINRGPMEGRRFPDAAAAAQALVTFFDDHETVPDGDTFWRSEILE